MKKIVLLLSFCFAIALTGNAQTCTVDTTFTTETAFSPDPLPSGCIGQAYDVDVTFVLPNDTIVFGFPANFVEHQVMAVNNVPPGLAWSCNVANCLYPVTQGQITRGCMKINGTPTATTQPTDSVSIMVRSRISTFLGNIDTTNGFNRHIQIDAVCGTARENAFIGAVSVVPNPAVTASVLSLDVLKGTQAEIRLYDVMGREAAVVFNGNLTAGTSRYELFADKAYTPGVYFVKVSLNQGRDIITRKVVLAGN